MEDNRDNTLPKVENVVRIWRRRERPVNLGKSRFYLHVVFVGTAKKGFIMRAILALILTVSFAISGGVSEAATIDYKCDIANVTGSVACQIGSANNDKFSARLEQVNVDKMFGELGWELLAKDNRLNGTIDDGADPLNLTFVADKAANTRRSGFWSIDVNAFTKFTKLMLVFKGSNSDETIPSNYIGYLISNSGGALSDLAYNTPFFKMDGDRVKYQNISHATLYGISAVPLPAAGFLLIGAFGALGAMRRRKG
ncbi:MAG: VPLPA-CTERM sorting domain-containing protein [Paracoccaceae bacterium]